MPRGGFRPGAGRKAAPSAKILLSLPGTRDNQTERTLTLPVDVGLLLASIIDTNGNPTRFLRNAIVRESRRRSPRKCFGCSKRTTARNGGGPMCKDCQEKQFGDFTLLFQKATP